MHLSLSRAPAHTSPKTPVATQGWTNSPNDRGTFDIIWGCLLTLFLCAWTTICVNIPSQRLSPTRRFWRKFLVFCETLAGPEFIFHTALGQYMAAKKSVRDFDSSGCAGWTIQHGFFADMGGFVLHPPDSKPFPLTVNQVHYLVAHGFINFCDVFIDKTVIEDKNKFDTLTRILTSVQLLWFVVNTVARLILGKAISTLELSTIAFAFCTFLTCFCWRKKPQNVSTPIDITLNVPLAAVLADGGRTESQPYSYTPLDFANDNPHHFELIWRYCFNLPQTMGLPFRFHSAAQSVDKIWDDHFSQLALWPSVVLALVQAAFAGIHFGAWNFYFPSKVEQILWRVSASYVICSMVCTWLIIYGAFEFLPWLARRLQLHENAFAATGSTPSPWKHSFVASVRRLCQKTCNNSPKKNDRENVPLFAVVTLVPLGAVYLLVRAYIFLEDVINLRELPTSAYEAVNWSAFIPHF